MNKIKTIIYTFLSLFNKNIFIDSIKGSKVNIYNVPDYNQSVDSQAVNINDKKEIEPPYISDYRSSENFIFLQEYLEELGTPMSFLEYDKLFKELINEDTFVKNENNFIILKKIYSDMCKVYEKIKPLEKLGIKLTLDITGGCVRDFVLGVPIKDLDIMLSFNGIYLNNITSEKLLEVGFSKEDLSKAVWDDKEKDEDIRKTQLINLCFLGYVDKSFTITDRLEREDSRSPYVKAIVNRLCGVVKIDMKGNYNIDVLVTDMQKPEFVENFDINLCKASMCFINNYAKKKFPQEPEDLLSRFSGDLVFFADILNKKLTIDVNLKTPSMLDAIIDDHLPRIKEKYPDYELNLISPRGENLESLIYARKKILEPKIPIKPENRVKKIKI